MCVKGFDADFFLVVWIDSFVDILQMLQRYSVIFALGPLMQTYLHCMVCIGLSLTTMCEQFPAREHNHGTGMKTVDLIYIHIYIYTHTFIYIDRYIYTRTYSWYTYI